MCIRDRNERLFHLVGFARKIGYERVNVTTNGRMAAYSGFAEKLANSGVTSILFSIHGPDAQTHAQNVGVAEAFDQTCACLLYTSPSPRARTRSRMPSSA